MMLEWRRPQAVRRTKGTEKGNTGITRPGCNAPVKQTLVRSNLKGS